MSRKLSVAVVLGVAVVVGSVWATSGKIKLEPTLICPCLENADCRLDEFCLKPLGECDAAGECVARLPEIVQCLAVWDPVCGCDGVTYSTGCHAQKAGVSLAHDGACSATCLANADCPPEQFCGKAPGDCAGEGECVDRLDDLTQCFAVWDPVCGCDGNTYSNGCYAHKAAMTIDHFGECAADPPAASGSTGD